MTSGVAPRSIVVQRDQHLAAFVPIWFNTVMATMT